MHACPAQIFGKAAAASQDEIYNLDHKSQITQINHVNIK